MQILISYKPIFFLLLGIFLCSNTNCQSYKIHSHNDYTRRIPFWEAAAAHAASIEVDVLLLRDTLFVAHERATIQPGWTFEALYLEPIRLSATFGFSLHPALQLLVDCKTEAFPTLPKIIEKCEAYRSYLYQPETGTGVKIIVSGNRPPPEWYHQSPAYLFFDHQNITDLANIALDKVGMVSLPFYRHVQWNGMHAIPEKEKEKIVNIVKKVHQYNVPFRFWATPDTPEAWKLLPELGVDFINTDKPLSVSSWIK
jgi:alkaline phosphatase